MPGEAAPGNFAVLLGLAWLAAAGWLLVAFWSGTADGFSDPDDAMRLVELRAFLHGRGWFDLFEPRVDPPFGYLTHWSRLVDAGLAALYLACRAIAGGALAERLTVALWPLLWLLPAMGAAAAIAWRVAGRDAALVALVLAAFGLPAFQQFRPGRIDHHNVQIALALLTIAAAAWSDRMRRAAAAAGALTAFALAVGLESLPYLALAGAALAVRYALTPQGAAPLRAYGLSLAAGAAVAFFATVPPARWVFAACDALAINAALAVAAAGLLLAAAGHWFAASTAPARWTCIALAAGAALALGLSFEPRCVGGPFALMDPAARTVWFADVREMQPLGDLMRAAPIAGVWVSAFPAAALIAFAAAFPRRRHDAGFLLAGAALAVAAAETVAVVKAYSYAMWFAMPVMAAAASDLFERLRLSRPVRFVGAALLAPAAISSGAITLAQAAGDAADPVPRRQACFSPAAYGALAQLPAGLVAADVDFGPFILAYTPHSVLAAPYHRLAHGIIAAHDALASPSAQARALMRSAGVSYLVLCGAARPAGIGTARADGLWAALQHGAVPDWLTPLPPMPDAGFAIYRVTP